MNVETETFMTTIPDYACRDNGGMTVITTGFIQNGKVVNISIRHGHYDNN